MEQKIKKYPTTFEKMNPLMISICMKYAKRFHVELWELINEVWLKGRIQKAKNFKDLCMVINWDCKDILRIKCDFRRKYKLSMVEVPDFWEPTAKKERSKMESDDWFDFVLTGFSKEEILIMKSIYIGGASFEETARAVGLCESRISQIHKTILRGIKDAGRAKD